MRPLFRHAVLTSFVAVPIAFAACGSPAAKLAADKNGDLSYLLRDRRRPEAELVTSCGSGALGSTGEATLARAPYLQQVTTESALVAFTSRTSEPIVVDVTRPDGTPIASFPATPDPNGRAKNATQLVARLQGLEPGKIHCYELRGLTARTGFRTAPLADSLEPVRVLAFGDSGTGSDEQYALLAQMFTVPFDLVLHTGDVAYESGRLSQLESGFFSVYQELTKSFAFVPVSGNHDYNTEHGAPFRDVFLLPENGGAEGRERWFSFDWGRVHFVALDTEVMGEQQAVWLEQDLQKNDEPWTIVYAHRPAFSSGRHGSFTEFRTTLHPILAKYRVPLVLNGHEHNYERTHPQDGVVYVVTGGGGRGTRSVGKSSFTAFSEDVIHFVQLEIHASELLLHAIDGTGQQFDSLRIAAGG